MRKTTITVAMLILAFAGFLDATYLTVKDLTHGQVACTISGCETVLTSKYSHVGPVPISMFGVGYYLLLAVLLVSLLLYSREWMAKSVRYLVPIGILVSAVLASLQVFVIHSICVYCMGSAVDSTLLFFIGWFGLRPAKANALGSES